MTEIIATEATAVDQVAVLPVPHRAACRQCPASVLFHGTASGNGIVVLEQSGMELDTPIGIGDAGLPVCPNGHGEMELADETIPAADAIAQVAEQLQTGDFAPLQGTLPGVFPDFNYQAAYLELEGKAQEVDNLKHEWEADKEAAAASKKAWEKAAETYTKMALEFQRRRREKVETGSPVTDLDQSRCTYEQLHPDQDCPLCDNSIADIAEMTIAPTNSAEHAQQAEAMLLTREVKDLIDLLDGVANMAVSEETVRGWSSEERQQVLSYGNAVMGGEDPLPERPKCLGTMHVAGEPTDDGAQACTQCDAVLRTADDETDNYIPGWLVGTDCPGKPVEEQRYIKRNKKPSKGKGRK